MISGQVVTLTIYYTVASGKIQALKKTATKGDKKKKKEVSDLISKLEMELDMKHSQELSSFSSDTPDNVSEIPY